MNKIDERNLMMFELVLLVIVIVIVIRNMLYGLSGCPANSGPVNFGSEKSLLFYFLDEKDLVCIY